MSGRCPRNLVIGQVARCRRQPRTVDGGTGGHRRRGGIGESPEPVARVDVDSVGGIEQVPRDRDPVPDGRLVEKLADGINARPLREFADPVAVVADPVDGPLPDGGRRPAGSGFPRCLLAHLRRGERPTLHIEEQRIQVPIGVVDLGQQREQCFNLVSGQPTRFRAAAAAWFARSTLSWACSSS